MKEKIKSLMEKGFLLDPEVAETLDENTYNLIDRHLNSDENVVLTKSVIEELKQKYSSLQELNITLVEENFGDVKIIKNYEDIPKKVEVLDFVEHYKIRYNVLKKILQNRSELADVVSINRLFNKPERERVSVIGLVLSKEITKNNHIILELEDVTSSIKVLISNNNKNVYDKAKEIVLDEVIGITGSVGNKIIFANDVFFPDIILNGNNIKKSEFEDYVVFISDIHVGSKLFLEEEFLKFIKWLNGEFGNAEQKQVAKSVKYLIIVGDIVDGVGVYPGQDEELTIKELSEQYEKLSEYLKKIRNDIKIVMCPGNHDAIRLSEPQPVFDKCLAKSIWELPNVILVTNPAVINIGSYENFSGFNILLYHGYSFDYYIDKMDSIRNNGGYDRADLVMKFLLQKRHLAPSHTSSLFIVDPNRDHLIIDEIPDIFASGHLHKSSVSQYGKTTTICGSCWQATTKFQEKVGHHPEPCRVPYLNLKNREVKILKFME
ncbi:DNA-directed DNA polymerase II small subunit [Candidatus Woesearchaeota archaeon]|nr:DNA-directed DNA polymerase II small subunit [Candidatus Woesearchaeota archaeon]